MFNRGEHPMMVFDRDGNFLRSWGEGQYPRAHGLHIDDDTLYLTDDGGIPKPVVPAQAGTHNTVTPLPMAHGAINCSGSYLTANTDHSKMYTLYTGGDHE